jgi:hypothetical protein
MPRRPPPGRGPPYRKSQVLRRQVISDEDGCGSLGSAGDEGVIASRGRARRPRDGLACALARIEKSVTYPHLRHQPTRELTQAPPVFLAATLVRAFAADRGPAGARPRGAGYLFFGAPGRRGPVLLRGRRSWVTWPQSSQVLGSSL